jgi:hypothetical protein
MCVYVCVCVCDIFIVHSSVNGHNSQIMEKFIFIIFVFQVKHLIHILLFYWHIQVCFYHIIYTV